MSPPRLILLSRCLTGVLLLSRWVECFSLPGRWHEMCAHFDAGILYSWGYQYQRRQNMPDKKHVRGVGEKEQRQYEHIKEDAEKSGRYGERAEEVAARTVLKEHKQKQHKKGQ